MVVGYAIPFGTALGLGIDRLFRLKGREHCLVPYVFGLEVHRYTPCHHFYWLRKPLRSHLSPVDVGGRGEVVGHVGGIVLVRRRLLRRGVLGYFRPTRRSVQRVD